MDGLTPLILCLPKDVSHSRFWLPGRASNVKLTLDRPLFAEDWKIFNYYACRIRSLTIDRHHLRQIDGRVVTALISTSSPALLPNLHRLQWLDCEDSFYPLLRALLAPTIKSIVLGSNRCNPSFSASVLLTSLGVQCPHIQEFACVRYDSGSSEASDVIWEAIRCWSKLVHIKTGVLDVRALAHLASLPSLKSLHFTPYGFVDGTQPNPIPTFTSNIDEVSITALTLPILMLCLGNIHFISCRSVALYINCATSGDDFLQMANLILSLSQCFSPTLERLIVKFHGLISTLSMNALSTAEPNAEQFSTDESEAEQPESVREFTDRSVLRFDAITPLLLFGRLTVVDLSWFCASAIDNTMVKKMAQSWPHLEEFHLGTGAHSRIGPSLTFTGLVHLLRHCRRLRNIAMVFRATSKDSNMTSFYKTIPNEKITSIFVGNSPITSPTTMACHLHTLLPNLSKVNCFPNLKYSPKWKEVQQFLAAFVEGENLKQKHAQALRGCSLST